MELGRKFIFAVLCLISIVGICLYCISRGVPVSDGVIASIATICLAYTGTNVAATWAHNSAATSTVSQAVTREIAARRAETPDGTERTE